MQTKTSTIAWRALAWEGDESLNHYQDVERPDFQADIVVDDDSLVVVYSELFTAQV